MMPVIFKLLRLSAAWPWTTANNPGKPGGLWEFLGVEKGKHSLGPEESPGAYRAASSAWAVGGSGNQFPISLFYYKIGWLMSFKTGSMDLGWHNLFFTVKLFFDRLTALMGKGEGVAGFLALPGMTGWRLKGGKIWRHFRQRMKRLVIADGFLLSGGNALWVSQAGFLAQI